MMPLHRLPVKDTITAIALHTAGFHATPAVVYHDRPGISHVTWWIDQNPAAADNLLAAWRCEDPARSLERTAPEHPFLAARYACEALPVFREWLEKGGPPPLMARTHGRLFRVFPAGTLPEAFNVLATYWSAERRPAFGIADAATAAALAVCGFPFHPQIIPPGSQSPAAAFAADSPTFPGLTAADLQRQLASAFRVDYPPGFPPGEHPWEYALTGARNAALAGAAIAPKSKNPSIWFQGDGTTGALASLSLLEESNKNSEFRDELHRHLS